MSCLSPHPTISTKKLGNFGLDKEATNEFVSRDNCHCYITNNLQDIINKTGRYREQGGSCWIWEG